MKRAKRKPFLTQENDCRGEFHMTTKKQIYNHMKRTMRAYLSHKSMIILVSSIWQLKNKFIII